MVNMALDSRSRFPSGFMLQKEDEAGGYASHFFCILKALDKILGHVVSLLA